MTVDIARLTAHLSPEQQESVRKTFKRQAENETTAFLLCFFLGVFGAHRFYLRQTAAGFAHLVLTLLAVAVFVAGLATHSNLVAALLAALAILLLAIIWTIVDLFRIDGEVDTRNIQLAEHLIASALLADPSIITAAQSKLLESVREVAGSPAGTVVTTASSAFAAESTASGGVMAGQESDAASVTEASRAASVVYEANTVTQISAVDDQPSQESSGEQHWSTTEYTHIDEATGEAVASEDSQVSNGFAVAHADEAVRNDELATDEIVTRSHTETAFSSTDVVETRRQTVEASTVEDETVRDTTAGDSTGGSDALIAGAGMAVGMVPPVHFVERTDEPGVSQASPDRRVDMTDRALPAEHVPPVADIDTWSGASHRVRLAATGGESTDASAAPQAGAVPVWEQEVPAEAYIPPAVPVIAAGALEAHAAATSGSEEQGRLLDQQAASVPQAYDQPGDVVHTAEVGEAHHALRRIRVVRQIKVNGQVTAETAAEELIGVDEDPEPVKARLREQLRLQSGSQSTESAE